MVNVETSAPTALKVPNEAGKVEMPAAKLKLLVAFGTRIVPIRAPDVPVGPEGPVTPVGDRPVGP